MKTYRWLLISPDGQKIKAYYTTASKGLVLLNTVNQHIVLSPSLDKDVLEKNKELAVLGNFENGKVVRLNHGFCIKNASDHEEIVANKTYPDEDESENKPIIGYIKKSAVTHIATVLSLILLSFILKSNESKIEPPKVTLVEIKKTVTPATRVVPETKKIVKKTIATSSTNNKKTNREKTQDKTQLKTLAILQGLQQSHSQQVKSKHIIKSLSHNSGSTGGGTFGSNLGGTPSKIGTTGLRAAQFGGGSLGSKSSSGYGKIAGGSVAPQGLKIISNQRGFSLPSGSDDNFAASGLDRDQIIAVINRHRGEITYCYEQALKRDSNIRGKIAIQFVISPSGKVTKAHVAESNTNSIQLESCMVARLRSWQFPKPIGAVNVDVLYPFHLSKLGQR